MNKKQLLRIKKAMCYEDSPEQKRTLRQIKKQYKALSEKERIQFLEEVEAYFANKK
jgi:hypothetical protein